jgi:hypothetical protein
MENTSTSNEWTLEFFEPDECGDDFLKAEVPGPGMVAHTYNPREAEVGGS